MKLLGFRAFTGSTASDVLRYLSTDLASAMQELRAGLSRLTFAENFETFSVDLEIAANSEVQVRNRLKFTPTAWIAVRKNKAGLSVCDGDTAWTQDYLYLKNTHATDQANLTVVFFR